MPVSLWQAVLNILDAGIQRSDAVGRARRAGPGKPVPIAFSGFFLIIVAAQLVGSLSLAGYCTIPPAIVALWSARRAWGAPGARRPYLTLGFLAVGLAGLLFTFGIVTPERWLFPLLPAHVLTGALVAVGLGLGLILRAWFRDELDRPLAGTA
jgi:hypothetical protein